jgi:glycosyltransferase involved in cell wall biosynthesis
LRGPVSNSTLLLAPLGARPATPVPFVPKPTALFLIHDLRPGGAERVFLQYVTHLSDVRVVPVLVRPHGEWVHRLPPGTTTYHLERGGTRARSVDELVRGAGHPARSGVPLLTEASALLVKARRLARIAGAERARLVSTFLHKSHAIALTARSIFARELRIVVNVHEQPSRHVETHFPESRRRWARLLAGRGISSADRVVAVAPGIARELQAIGVYPPGRLAVAPNPVDTLHIRAGAAEVLPREGLPEGDGPLLVGVGRLERIKGFDLLVDAVAAGNPSWRLVLVGDGSQADELRRRVDAHGLGDRVRTIGHRDNPYPWIAAADLLVLPSRTDAWPSVIGEAFALGTPVLAARCSPSVDEFLGSGERGLLADPDDPAALRRAIQGALGDPAGLRARAESATAWIADHSLATATARYARLLLETCA